jgi:hypothetical protein
MAIGREAGTRLGGEVSGEVAQQFFQLSFLVCLQAMYSDLKQLFILQVGIVQLLILLQAPLQLLVLNREIVNDTAEVLRTAATGCAKLHLTRAEREGVCSVVVDRLVEAVHMTVGRALGGGTVTHEEWRIIVGVRVAVVPYGVVRLVKPLVRIAALARTTSSIERAQTRWRVFTTAGDLCLCRGAAASGNGMLSFEVPNGRSGLRR